MHVTRTSNRRSAGTFRGWTPTVVSWFAISLGLVLVHVIGGLSLDNLVFAEICAITLGGIALFVGNEMNEPPEIVEQVLYRTEHRARS